MARKTANRTDRLYQRAISLKEAHAPLLDLVAPDSHSEGVRFLMQWAINRGALTPFLNLDGTAPNPPHSTEHLSTLRRAALAEAYNQALNA